MMNPFGEAKFRLGKIEIVIRFIPQGVKEYFTFEATEDGELDVAMLNTLCLRYAVVSVETYDREQNSEESQIHGKPIEMWTDDWYEEMPSGYIEGINNHIYVHNNLNPEKVDGLNFI